MPNYNNTVYKNNVNVSGYVFSASIRTGVTSPSASRPNAEYISGTINVATDEQATTTVPVNFFTYKSRIDRSTGREVPNDTYTAIEQIASGLTFEQVGTQALKVRAVGSLDTNDFYSTRNEEMVAAQRVRGGFMHVDATARVQDTTFDVNMVATSAVEKERAGQPSYLEVKGYVFNYNGSRLFPITLECHDDDGIGYLMSLDISNRNPVVMNAWGHVGSTIIELPHNDEAVTTGFGVRPRTNADSTRTYRTWFLDGIDVSRVPEFGTQEPFTNEAMRKLLDEREVMLEGIKQKALTSSGRASTSFGGGFQSRPKPAQTTDTYDDDIPF